MIELILGGGFQDLSPPVIDVHNQPFFTQFPVSLFIDIL